MFFANSKLQMVNQMSRILTQNSLLSGRKWASLPTLWQEGFTRFDDLKYNLVLCKNILTNDTPEWELLDLSNNYLTSAFCIRTTFHQWTWLTSLKGLEKIQKNYTLKTALCKILFRTCSIILRPRVWERNFLWLGTFSAEEKSSLFHLVDTKSDDGQKCQKCKRQKAEIHWTI